MLAAVYCRVSTEKDDQINSLASQREYFLHYIEKCPELELYQIYADRGISGTAANNRTRFMQMMEDAEKGCFNIIITKEVSRFSRNIIDAVSYSRKLRGLGVAIRFMNDGIDTSQPDAELRLSIMASLAQEESRKTSDRVKWGQTRRMEAGVVFGSSMLGYDVEKGKIKINAFGAEIVRMIFEKYVCENMSASKIALELENMGIKTYRSNKKWNPSVIMKILKNEKYCGDLLQKKTFTPDYLTHRKMTNNGREKSIFIKDHHQAIVSRILWEEAQKEIKRRSHVKKRKSGIGTKYPLSGKIICACCGSPFVLRKRNGKDGTYMVWKCSTSVKGRNCPVRYQIRDDNILYMSRYSYSLLNIDREKIINKICLLIRQAKDELKNRSRLNIEQLNSEIEDIKRKKLDIIDLYVSGRISENDFQNLTEKYEVIISNHNEEISRLTASEETDSYYIMSLVRFLENILYYNNITNSIIYNCIKKVEVLENGIVRIYFKFLQFVFEFKTPYRSIK